MASGYIYKDVAFPVLPSKIINPDYIIMAEYSATKIKKKGIITMTDLKIKEILVEYYDTISPLLRYTYSSEKEDFSEKLKLLILSVFDAESSYDEVSNSIEGIEMIQTIQDIALIQNDSALSSDSALYIKASVLKREEVKSLESFDMGVVVLKTRQNALMGDISSCKLWACMNWLGVGVAMNKRAAIEIWKQLAICGDQAALKATIYANNETENIHEKDIWTDVESILATAYDTFVPVMVKLNVTTKICDKSFELANIILTIKERLSRENKDCYLNRWMAYYALYSHDSFSDKLKNLACERDFCPLFINSVKRKNNHIGFVADGSK